MLTRKLSLIGLFFFLISTNQALAGFGITPPYVRNNSLTQNSNYSQSIILTRNDPIEDLTAKVTINIPGADDWISVDQGFSFLLPKGEMKVPMMVKVHVPEDAKPGDYNGNIRVILTPKDNPTPGTVGISLGAQIDVRLTVVDKEIYEFKIRRVKVDDLEEGRTKWGLFFPGKIKFSMQTENLGNVPFGPTKVVLDIKDSSGVSILETTSNLNRLKKVKAFEIDQVIAELPTRLAAGIYKANFKIYKNEEVVHTGELDLGILPPGTLPGYEGYGFWGLRTKEQVVIAGGATLIFLVVVLILVKIVGFIKHRKRRSR